MGGKKGGGKTRVTQYYMSLHYGICHAVDEIKSISIKEKRAWSGSLDTVGGISINRSDMFGGVKKEGGAVGTAYWLPGDANQVMPSALAQRVGLTPSTMPAYRGMASIWFIGSGSRRGFYWGANTPWIPPVWVEVKRAPEGLDPAVDMIGEDANPIHIIFESMTNTDWGMGSPTSAFNMASFHSAAQTIYDEGFGLSMLWSRQSAIESFVSEVIDHIEASLFVDPMTGLWTIKLIRDDYDPDTLDILTPDNCDLSNFQRKLWGEVVNEVVVTWTNPANEQDETVSVQDLANISMQGGVISTSANYYGIRRADLAQQVAQRDLRVSASPLASMEAEADRTFYNKRPGDVVKVTWPKYGIHELICRVGNVDYGKPGDPWIKMSLVEDVFSLTPAAFTEPPETAWEDPSEDPRPLDHALVLTAPYYVVGQLGLSSDVEYPTVVSMVLGAQDGQDTSQFELYTDVPQPEGGSIVDTVGTLDVVARGVLVDPLNFEAESMIDLVADLTQGLGPVVSGLAVIGSGDDLDTELVLITAITDTTITIRRGVLDTVPREWAAGTPIWFFSQNERITDGVVKSAEEVVDYFPTPWTSRGVLSLDDAVPVQGTLSARPWLPLRPANVTVQGQTHGKVDATALTEVTINWANRNRFDEDTVILPWDTGNVTPEENQTTKLVLMDLDRNVVKEIPDLTGTTYTLALSEFGALMDGLLRVVSEREDLESLQGQEFQIKLPAGYGGFYGHAYGS